MAKWQQCGWLLVVLLGVLAACGQQAVEETAVPLPTLAATSTPVPLPTALPTLVPPTQTSLPPTPTAVFPPPNYFAHVASIFRDEAGNTAVAGIVDNGSGPRLAELPVPGSANVFNGEYALATNQILYTDRAHAAGPGNLAAGPLHSLKMSSGQQDTLVADGVVNFAWGPDGRAFAYILATDETYQLRWRSAEGADLLLAVDAPRALGVAPSGTQVAFTRESGYEVGGEPGLYLVDVAGGAERQIVAIDRAGMGGTGPAWQPLWSPDESSLLLRLANLEGKDFIWTSRDGRAVFAFPISALHEAVNAAWLEAYPDSATAMCADDTRVLVNGRALITGVTLCPEPMSGSMPGSHLAVLAVDPDAETITATDLQRLPDAPAYLAGWHIPGESVFVIGDAVASVSLPVTSFTRPTTDVPITPTVELSPDGQWQVVYGLSEPVAAGENRQVYRAYLAVQQTGGGLQWTAVDQWRTYGLGLDYPAPLQWSSDQGSGDGRYLYFTNRPIVDGCGLFANGSDLWRLDLTNGAYVQLVSSVGASIALSPDGQTLAYARATPNGLVQVILRDVATGAEWAIDLDEAAPTIAGNLVWSPDGARLLATVAYNPCLPPDWTHSIFLVDVAAATAVPLITRDDRRLTTLAWTGPDTAHLIGVDGARWLLSVTTGDLTPADE